MTINDEILAIANRLANNGKTPSVALIKTKLSQPTPLPQIIAVLKTWVHDPEFTQITIKEPQTEPSKNFTVEQKIAAAIAPLEQEITELKVLVQSLIKKA